MRLENIFNGQPIEYQDGNISMRLVLIPSVGICLEWCQADGTWVEVTSMRPAAFEAFVQASQKCGKIVP